MKPHHLVENWEEIARDMEILDSRGSARRLRKDSNVYNDCAHMLKATLIGQVLVSIEDLQKLELALHESRPANPLSDFLEKYLVICPNPTAWTAKYSLVLKMKNKSTALIAKVRG